MMNWLYEERDRDGYSGVNYVIQAASREDAIMKLAHHKKQMCGLRRPVERIAKEEIDARRVEPTLQDVLSFDWSV